MKTIVIWLTSFTRSFFQYKWLKSPVKFNHIGDPKLIKIVCGFITLRMDNKKNVDRFEESKLWGLRGQACCNEASGLMLGWGQIDPPI